MSADRWVLVPGWSVESGTGGFSEKGDRWVCVRHLESQCGQDFYEDRDPLIFGFLSALVAAPAAPQPHLTPVGAGDGNTYVVSGYIPVMPFKQASGFGAAFPQTGAATMPTAPMQATVPAPAAPAAEPVAYRVLLDGLWLHAASADGLIEAVGVKFGRTVSRDSVEPLYAAPGAAPAQSREPLTLTVEQARHMIEGAWCAGYYDAGYTHDSAYAGKKAEECADQLLGLASDAHGIGSQP